MGSRFVPGFINKTNRLNLGVKGNLKAFAEHGLNCS